MANHIFLINQEKFYQIFFYNLVHLKAAEENHLDILRYCRQVANPPCPWGASTLCTAAAGGHLRILEWARNEANPKCPWSARSCATAAANGMRVATRDTAPFQAAGVSVVNPWEG